MKTEALESLDVLVFAFDFRPGLRIWTAGKISGERDISRIVGRTLSTTFGAEMSVEKAEFEDTEN